MKTFIAMLIMSVGFMLFGQTMTAESVMKDYKIQHDKIVSEFVTKMQTQNNATIKKLETINSESSKEKADVLKNWSIDSIKTDASDIKIPVAPGVVIDRKPLPKDAVEFKGHHYLQYTTILQNTKLFLSEQSKPIEALQIGNQKMSELNLTSQSYIVFPQNQSNYFKLSLKIFGFFTLSIFKMFH